MRRTTPCALAATALLLTAGCGAQTGDTGSGASRSPSSRAPSAPAPSSPAPSAPATGGCRAQVELTAADNGRTVCVSRNGEVRLTLDGTPDRPFRPVTATGTALRAINAGFVIQPGDATAAYRAVAAGTAKLTSSRPLCPTTPGQITCKGLQAWTVTVTVR
ncbi:hypothetical protein C3489_28425 [Streptomyces sp. Ru71]|uniref:hypothetical protein n=1 Tax=Streptomyces sp. Ru71 TaxID=2080746 RepID=UPI000CDD8F65|nr:hypothetical protein [Streptomyces sp. Ru71]POX47888.1 hypothetical protein C3489_28425 [Streptomyces sp. Ru71]